MEALFQIYQSKYLFTADELSLFLAMVLLDEKIVFGNDCYQNTVVIQNIYHMLIMHVILY